MILNNIKQIKIVSIILSLISGFIKPIMYNINDIIIKQKISNPVPIKALKVFWWIGALNTSEAICFQPNSSIIAFSLFFLFHLANLKFITQKYCAIHSRIVNSCNPNDFKDKVALVVGVCNDFLPNTLLQTANQTYKNIDVWICDDSNDPKTIQEIDDFVKKHKNVYVCRRPDEHKKLHRTKIGNVSYWLGKYGLQYDYVF